jgi:hypothetical protein
MVFNEAALGTILRSIYIAIICSRNQLQMSQYNFFFKIYPLNAGFSIL